MTDGFDFFKNIWSSMSIPQSVAPTTDLAELDKRIADLKAVEQWLNLNLNMLRATIQGFEVQRGALGMMQAFTSAANQASPGSPVAANGTAGDPIDVSTAMMSNASAWWGMMQQQLQDAVKVGGDAAGETARPSAKPPRSTNVKPPSSKPRPTR